MFKQYELFGGKVVAIDYSSAEGQSTIGVISPGVYKFGTDADERLTITSGEISYRKYKGDDWVRYGTQSTFTVGDGEIFELKAEVVSTFHLIRG